eukprot:scaffold2119_cov264-Pinguiococcus_pyrenoidosus.AAC.2
MPRLLQLDVATEHAEVLRRLRGANPAVYTLETLLSRKSRLLARETPGVSAAQIEDCKRAVAQHSLGRVYTALSFVKMERALKHFRSGSKALDDCIGGGFRSGEMVEVVGPSGVGKTQLALSAAMCAALRGDEVLYVDTGNVFQAKRAAQIGLEQLALHVDLLEEAERAARDRRGASAELTAEHMVSRAMSRIQVIRAFDAFSLLDALYAAAAASDDGAANGQAAPPPALLVVVDSITAVLAPMMGRNMAGTKCHCESWMRTSSFSFAPLSFPSSSYPSF